MQNEFSSPSQTASFWRQSMAPQLQVSFADYQQRLASGEFDEALVLMQRVESEVQHGDDA